MPNVKISAAADAGTLLSSDMLPLARSGNTNAYHTTMSSVATFTNASLSSGAYGNVGRNLLHNSMFNIAQRGAGNFTTNGYTLDRWSLSFNLDTATVAQGTFTPGGGAGINDEASSRFLSNTFTGNAGAASFTTVQQAIEDVRRLSGKTVTVSFYAAAASGAPKLGVSLDQLFGTGGSPSARANGTGQSVTLGTTFARYSLTFTLPSIIGMTLGTNNDHCTALILWYSSGTSTATRAGNVGVQSGTIYLWGMQLEIGSVATPLEKPDPRYDLSNCQRFYQWHGQVLLSGNTGAGTPFYNDFILPVQMRGVPTVSLGNFVYSNASGAALNTAFVSHVQLKANITASGYGFAMTDIGLSADL